jgi:hypothetical protein
VYVYDILIEVGIPLKLVRLINTCLHEAYSRDRIGKICLTGFPLAMF